MLLVKVKGQVKVRFQGQRSSSNFWHAVVDIRGLALLSATKSKEESLSVQGVCVWNDCMNAVDRLLIALLLLHIFS